MVHERRASPLHAARASVAAAYGLALVCTVLAFEHPVVLGALAVALAGAALGAGVGSALLRMALFAVPFAITVALVNPLVSREGLTVVARLGELPVLGRLDVTSEALAFGGVLGLRALLVVLAGGALLAATVDPDEVLRGLRRFSLRSALTAALAVRLVPVLARDARGLAEARRCRPGAAARPTAGERLQIVGALATSALDRALDTAATLEVRGYGLRGAIGAEEQRVSHRGRAAWNRRRASRPRTAAGERRPWSRHDLAFAVSAAGLLALAAGARLQGVAGFDAYPTLHVPTGVAEAGLCVALIVVALAPFADRRGIER